MTKIQQITRDAAIIRQAFSEPQRYCTRCDRTHATHNDLYCPFRFANGTWSDSQFKVGPL